MDKKDRSLPPDVAGNKDWSTEAADEERHQPLLVVEESHVQMVELVVELKTRFEDWQKRLLLRRGLEDPEGKTQICFRLKDQSLDPLGIVIHNFFFRYHKEIFWFTIS